jgi:hypothetical protein
MSDNPLALLGQSISVPSLFHPLMDQQTSSELQSNVGQSFAVVSIKGKVFGIKFGGQTHQLTINYNGQQIAAPWFDVVIPKAKAELSKTWYKEGYQDGSEDAPTCWSEDGINPLAPMDQRPIDERTGAPCVDCRMCPMNVFGSKITDAGKQAKACADTRKVLVLPTDANGALDAENIKYGGAMMLRIPAASLKPLAEYDQKLQQMGIPYYAVVTRMSFDQTQAYPKFEFKAVRMVNDLEAEAIIKCRDGLQAKQILESSMVGAGSPSPVSDDPGLVAGNVPASLKPQEAPATVTGHASNVVPIHSTTPQHAPPATTVVPPQRVLTAKAAGFTLDEWLAKGWTEQQLEEHGYMEPLPQAVTVPSGGPQPGNEINVNPGLFATVETLLGR